MRIWDRSIDRMLKAPFEARHYRAVGSMYSTSDGILPFADTLRRYCFAAGTYPHIVRLRTPCGIATPTLYSYHDMLTINEIFFRHDYHTAHAGVVVDIGANIGLAALYFLTRNVNCRCYLFEPVPENVRKLKLNLADYSSRYVLKVSAVSTQSGTCEFGVELTGRYGGIGRETGNRITVNCITINQMLENVLSIESRIDVLKIDTEGTEQELVDAISPQHRGRIGCIMVESNSGTVLHINPAQSLEPIASENSFT